MNTPRHSQRGASLIESLVALLVLSLSLVTAVRAQAWLRQHGDLARERSEAVQRAQQSLEAGRTFRDLATFDRPHPLADAQPGTTTSFRVQHDSASTGGLKTEHVTVHWEHRNGGAQQLQLTTSMARLAPVHTALLELPPQDRVLAPQRVLPPGVHPLPDGRSIVKPSAESGIAWVVDTATGDIELQCSVAAWAQARDLRLDQLTGCEPFVARLVRGFIRFALSASPDPLRANDAPLQLSVQTRERRCESDVISGDGERYIAYVCAVTAGEEPVLVPHGWAFGLTADAFRACRYPGADRAPRNYLVVRGSLACPSGVPPHNGGPALATVQHQP